MKDKLKKLFLGLFSTSAAGLYTLLFAIAIGVATFVENDFGTSAAQKVIFKARWFEALLVLFGISLVVNIFRFRMVQNKKWGTLLFHAAMVIIIVGAGVTRYFGTEGMMNIREGSAANSYLSMETYLNFQVLENGTNFQFEEPVLFASLGHNQFKESYLVGNKQFDVHLQEFVPNPKEVLEETEGGIPILKIVIGGANGREEFLLKQGDKANIYGTNFNFGPGEIPGAFNIRWENNQLQYISSSVYEQTVMATRTTDTLAALVYHPLMLRSLYSNGVQSFVFGDFKPEGKAALTSEGKKMTSTSMAGLHLDVEVAGETKSVFVTGMQGVQGKPAVVSFGNTQLAVSYGAKRVTLPFSIKLRDFIMERYPGTENASSYASEVTLIDGRKSLARNERIYMNNILDYDGYRFFQSSFDQDELGTYLSVNHDAPGTIISYLGYFLLTLGMILTLFAKNSRFQELSRMISKVRQQDKLGTTTMLILFLCLGQSTAWAGPPPSTPMKVDAGHAELFGRLLMQDHKGRLKPMNTHANEIMRKLARKESLFGQTAEQILLGMTANPRNWYDAQMVKIGKHEEIRKLLAISGDMASYKDFFDAKGEYKLREAVRDAYNKPPRDRGVYEKELVKLDEKVNICSMIFSGSYMKMFPNPGDTTLTWISPVENSHNHQQVHAANSPQGLAEQFYPIYIPALQRAIQANDWQLVNRMLTEVGQYQQNNGGAILPSSNTVKAELLLNKLDIFNRLGSVYGLLGLVFLALLFLSVFKPKLNLQTIQKLAFGGLLLAFAFHTFGLGMRWYVSGRAPWSNGYESMIYIGWTTTLAGILFSRRSTGALAATNVLAATIMMVAHLSWLDPEITPLVPVLKSYWLTIHVSLEAGSYGFLVLGAIIGMLNLILMLFANAQNGEKIYRIIKEMTWISEMTLIGELFMVSIGTYLGGVWANESWGRYWGWDAKETWALVTILVYSFILHMRFIPGLRGLYAFNVATLFGWASVAMTYFGVNYYLSGLHSYAAGDPVPVPDFVYIIVFSLVIISLLAKWRYNVYHRLLKS